MDEDLEDLVRTFEQQIEYEKNAVLVVSSSPDASPVNKVADKKATKRLRTFGDKPNFAKGDTCERISGVRPNNRNAEGLQYLVHFTGFDAPVWVLSSEVRKYALEAIVDYYETFTEMKRLD